MSATVVTCYYRIHSKHSHEEYDKWLTDFLSNVNCNLIIFTSKDLVEYLYEKRGSQLKEKTLIIPIELENLELTKKYDWTKQYDMDNQKYTGRSKECYILWNSKLWFLKQVVKKNPFHSEKFIWNDIGCLRTNNTSIIQYIGAKYPNPEKISKKSIDIVLLKPIVDNKQKVFINEVHFSGAQFGGHKDVILIFYDLFYKRLDEHIKHGIFVGCDQQTISSVYNDHRELFNCIVPEKPWIDPWFFLWQYYS